MQVIVHDLAKLKNPCHHVMDVAVERQAPESVHH